MKVNGKNFRTIWMSKTDPQTIQIIDQRSLPHHFVIEDIKDVKSMASAIKDMHVRGAGLIGAAGGYGMYLAVLQAQHSKKFETALRKSYDLIISTRPTAINLSWALKRQMRSISAAQSTEEKIRVAAEVANTIADEDVLACQKIGQHGLELIQIISEHKNGEPVNILTHCNAGWLAFVDYGSATAPIYAAHDAGIKVHVYVDETRPRNQGANLTTWELGQHGVPHTLIVDNAGGHLMQNEMVDLVLTGTDRTTFTGDVANKIGTYLKALAAHDNNIPYYVALPSSTFDWKITDGLSQIPIEKRSAKEIKQVQGLIDGEIKMVDIAPDFSNAENYAFDITPARLVTGLITERGICRATKDSITKMFPEKGGHNHK